MKRPLKIYPLNSLKLSKDSHHLNCMKKMKNKLGVNLQNLT